MTEPEWLDREAVLALHARTLSLHGGAEGVRDAGLLDSALQRPLNRYFYEQVSDIVELAATYAVALASNHPFVDGNKRAGFQALLLFLRLNGSRLIAGRADATRVMLSVAAGETDIAALARWIRANSVAAAV